MLSYQLSACYPVSHLPHHAGAGKRKRNRLGQCLLAGGRFRISSFAEGREAAGERCGRRAIRQAAARFLLQAAAVSPSAPAGHLPRQREAVFAASHNGIEFYKEKGNV